MPNWCENALTIEGKKEDLEAFVEKAKGTGWQPQDEIINDLDCNKFVPMPQEVIDNGYSTVKDENIHSGYDWENENWGTKWGACETSLYVQDTYIQYTFDTAWSPMQKVIYAMIRQHPELEFHLDFAEYGMMFKGSISGFDGEVKAETSDDITSEEVCEMGWHGGGEQENSENCDYCHNYCIENDLQSEREPKIEEKIRMQINEDWNNEKTI